jgi:hypothetical protein
MAGRGTKTMTGSRTRTRRTNMEGREEDQGQERTLKDEKRNNNTNKDRWEQEQ